MAGNMDERVVSMEFDNKQFEKNVKTSMKTIDDLKESLDFDDTGKSFDEFTTKCKKFGKDNCFKDVDDSVSKLRKGIGLLGDSAGGLISQFAEVTKITAMFEMAEAAVNKLKAAVKSFTIEPISQGFDKYTTKINSIKTIANATGMAADQVDASLERLNWFTDETSASFDSMVQNIGKFTSVGKGLDESITAMQGIAAWGYHSGASIQEQNRAMYNLSQALGTGSVKLIDWKSIENAGMATKEFKEQAIAAAEAAGTLTRKGDKLFAGTGKKAEEVTVENFNSTLQKGWFSSDVLMSTLKEYGSFADKVRKYQEEHPQYALASEAMEAMDAERLAKQDAIYEKYLDTWSKNAGKSSAKIKEDVARINKIANVKEREKEIKAFAKTIGMSYEETKKALDDLADCEESLGEKAFKSSQQAKSFSEAIDATKDAVSTGWMKTFQYIFGGLDKSIELWSDVTEILWDLFAAGASFRNNAFMHWAEEFNGWADLWNADEEKGPLGALRNIANTIIELKELLGSSFKNVFFPELAKITGEIFGEEDAKTMAKNGLKTTDQLKQWREGNYMGYQIKNVTKGIREFTAKIREFFTNAENLEKIRTIFTSIATAVKFAVDTVGSFFKSVGDFIKKSGIIQDMLGLVSRIAAKITEIFGKIQKSGFIKNLFGKISDTFVWLYTTVKRWVNEIKEFFEETGIGQAIRDFFKRIEEFFLGGENDVDETGKKTESGFFRAFGWIKDVKAWFDKINLKDVLYTVRDFIVNFGTLWGAFTAALNGEEVNSDQLVASGLPENLKGAADVFANVGKALSGVFGFFKSVWEGFTGWLESSGILPTLRSWWEGISSWFEGIKKDISENGFFGWIGSVFSGLWQTITGIFSGGDGLEELEDYATPLSSMVGDGKKKGVFANIVTALKNAANGIKKAFNWVKDKFNIVINWLTEKWQQFTSWLETSGVLPAIRSFWEKVKIFFTNFGEVWAAFKTSLSGQKLDKKALKNSGMDEGLQGIIETVWGWGNGIHNAIEWVKETWGKITDWLETSGILPTLRQWWSDITGWFEGVAKDIEENGVFGAVSNFFTGLWEKITGLFGGGPNVAEEAGKAAESAGGQAGEQEETLLSKIFGGFIKNGRFDLVNGIVTGISGLFEIIGSIDWTSISSRIFGVMVDVINGLNDACGRLEIGNIIKVIQQVVGAFTGVMIVKTLGDAFTMVRAIVKKGKDKSGLEKFTDLLAALGTALLQIGISVALIAASMWLISKIDPDRFDAAKGVMIGIGVFLVGFMLVAYILTRTMGKDANKLAKTFAAIGSMFLQIAIAVAIMVAAVWLVTLMLEKDGSIGDKLRTALIIVAGIMVVMAAIVVLIGQLTKNVGATNIAIGIATFAGIAILLAVCVAAILLLQNVEIGKAFKVILEIGVLLAMITAVLVILSKTVKKFNPKMLVGMITMAVMLALIVAAFYLLKDVPAGHLIETAGAIAIVIGVLVGALALCGVLGTKILIGAGVLAAGLVILAAALLAVSAMATGVMNNCVTFMSSLAAMSNSAKLVDLDAITTALGVLPIIYNGLSLVRHVDTKPALELVQAAWDVFTQLKLASFAAMLISEKQFEKVFGKDGQGGILQMVQTGMSSVTDTGWKASALGRSVNTLAENLKLIGQAGADLSKDAGGKTLEEGIHTVKDKLGEIQEIVQMAISMSTIGEDGTIDEDFLTKFSVGVGNIGAALKLYNEALATFEKEGENGAEGIEASELATSVSTEAISKALQSVMAVLGSATFDQSQIQEVEKWAGLDTGTNGGTLFALGLTNIATAMTSFAKSATEFNSDDVDKAIESLDKLADIKGKFETNSPADYKEMMDGVSEWGDGGSFQTAISGMGTAISAFGTSVQNLPSNAVKQATNALDTLAVIYEKLKGEGTVESYLAKIGSLTIGGSETTVQGVETTFQGFAAGISKLADGLAAFSAALTDKDIGYDQGKVDAAVKILQDMTKIETELKSVKVDGNWWHDLLFGENGIKKLGENMAGLGSRLATFSQELAAAGGFDIDVEGDLWKNISGVITFLADIQAQMNNLVWSSETYDDETGQMMGYVNTAGYTITDLANGLDKIREAMVRFNEAMQKTYDAGNGGYKLGSWDTSNFENIKSVITFLKDISVDLKTAGLENNKFYDLENLGNDMQQMFNKLDNSKMGEFLTKLQNFQDMTEALKTFTGGDAASFNTQGITLAAEMIMGFANRLISADASDGKGTLGSAFASLLSEIEKYNTDFNTKGKAAGEQYAAGFGKTDKGGNPALLNDILNKLVSAVGAYEQQFFDKGKALGDKFVEGFKNEQGVVLINRHSVFVSSITDTLSKIIGEMDNYLEQYKAKGKSAGESYAAGFQEGLEGSGMSSLTPIVAMDNNGQTATATGLGAILTTFGYATSTDIATLAERLDTINAHFTNPIKVDDAHTDIVNAIGTTNEKLGDLKDIKSDVGALKTDVKNLKVYIDSKILVGAIAPEMNRKLGAMANVSP